jgi:DNA polymerase-3 subunit gamma/tau
MSTGSNLVQPLLKENLSQSSGLSESSPAQNALHQLQAMQYSSTEAVVTTLPVVENGQGAAINTQQTWNGPNEAQMEPESISLEVLVDEPAEAFAEIHYNSNIENWLEIIKQLSLKGMAAEIARNSVLVEFSEFYMAVSIDPTQNYSNQDAALAQFSGAVKARFDETMVLEFVTVSEHFTPAKQAQQLTANKQAQAVQSIGEDVLVKTFSQQLDMHVIPESIQPV